MSIRVRPTLPREATKDECIYFPSREMATNLEVSKLFNFDGTKLEFKYCSGLQLFESFCSFFRQNYNEVFLKKCEDLFTFVMSSYRSMYRELKLQMDNTL